MRPLNLSIAIAISTLLSASVAFAWTGPTQTAPAGNVSAPINVGSTDQVKSASLGVNGLAVFGNSLLQAASYLNWGATAGSGGYGIRDNGGTLEFKNSAGSWSPFGTGALTGSGTANYVTKFAGASTLGSSIIYDSGSNVGIGAGTSPVGKLEVRHSIGTQTEMLRLRSNLATWQSYGLLTFVDDATGLVESQIKTELVWGSPEVKRTLTLGTKENLDTLNIYNGGVAIGTRLPTAKLTVGTAGSAGSSYYDIGAGKIAAGTSIYSYGSICAGNNAGDCSGAGGVLLTAAGAVTAVGNVTAAAFLYSSDRRLKERIAPIADSLSKTLHLSGVSYVWKTGPRAGQRDIGVIAQDVEKELPEAVHTDEMGMKSVDYPKLTPLLINAIKEQQAQIERLEARIEALEAKK